MLIGMVKRRGHPAMVDGRLRSGVNGAGANATLGRSDLSMKLRHVWAMEGKVSLSPHGLFE